MKSKATSKLKKRNRALWKAIKDEEIRAQYNTDYGSLPQFPSRPEYSFNPGRFDLPERCNNTSIFGRGSR